MADAFTTVLGSHRGAERPLAALPDVDDDETYRLVALALADERRYAKAPEGERAIQQMTDYAAGTYSTRRTAPGTRNGYRTLVDISGKAGASSADQRGLLLSAAGRHVRAIAAGESHEFDVAAATEPIDAAVIRYLAQLLRAPAEPEKFYRRVIGASRVNALKDNVGEKFAELPHKVDLDAVVETVLDEGMDERQTADYINAALTAAAPRRRKSRS